MNVKIIDRVIHEFYEVAKKDFMIGYHFRFIEDFDTHIPRIVQFWNLQLNNQIDDRSRLPFDLIKVHESLKVKKGELDRWVKLFEDNLNQFDEISVEDKNQWLEKVRLFRARMKKSLIRLS